MMGVPLRGDGRGATVEGSATVAMLASHDARGQDGGVCPPRGLRQRGCRPVSVAPPSMAAPVGATMHKHLPPRWDLQGAWYFVTVVTHERCPYFEAEEACRILMEACRSVCEKHPYRLGVLVIMPDHWHALIRPGKGEVIESIVGSIKQRVFHASRQRGGRIIRWQPKFMDHRIRSETDYHQHVEYMRLNPLKHELLKDESIQWKWWFVHANPFA